jgi:hypothetical protein
MTDINDNNNSDDTIWESGWDGHELAQMRRLAKLTMEQKIRWLESAQEMVWWMQQSQPAKNESVPPPGGR